MWAPLINVWYLVVLDESSDVAAASRIATTTMRRVSMAVKKREPAQETDSARRPARLEDGKRVWVRPIGVIRSTLKTRGEAPKQGSEGAPDAWLEVNSFAAPGLDGLAVGDDIIIVTWLHRARRDVLRVHPRSDPLRPLTGIFATRSPDRLNPLGLHRVKVRRVVGNRLRIGPLEAIDGTPVIDIKPVLSGVEDS
jgi:tRNA-Thr(GGU) m(6)t(6)A37 methyltransferase TsaA